MTRVRRLPAYLLSVLFVLMGSGALTFTHNLTHLPAVAAAAQECDASQPQPSKPAPTPFEHERDCHLHLMLASPLLDQAGGSAIVWQHASQWALQPTQGEPADSSIPARVDCRGPPSC